MKLKLTKAEFTVLYSLMQIVCIGTIPKKMEQVILHGVLFRLYKKFYNKAITQKSKYGITMENDEAAAFCVFFSKYEWQDEDAFTINLVHQINFKINQLFAA